jgi:hypothetical protein
MPSNRPPPIPSPRPAPFIPPRMQPTERTPQTPQPNWPLPAVITPTPSPAPSSPSLSSQGPTPSVNTLEKPRPLVNTVPARNSAPEPGQINAQSPMYSGNDSTVRSLAEAMAKRGITTKPVTLLFDGRFRINQIYSVRIHPLPLLLLLHLPHTPLQQQVDHGRELHREGRLRNLI